MTETLSVNIEDYLETIFLLIQEKTVARAKDIADRLNVSRPSVTGMLHTLRDKALIHYERYGFITLTTKGEKVASRVLRRHEALRDFMIDVLSINADEADNAACHMEHGVSKHVVDRFIAFGEFVQTCPRAGAKWVHEFGRQCTETRVDQPNCEQCIETCLAEVKKTKKREETAMLSVSLSDLKPGEKGQIKKVSGAGAVIRRIRDMGVTTGSIVEVIRVAPLGDPIDIKIKSYHLTLRKEEAARIQVSPL